MKPATLLGASLSLAVALPAAALADPMGGSGMQPGPMYQQGPLNQTGPMEQQGQQNNQAPAAARQLYRQLREAGFTDVHIRPQSFMVHARSPSGVPVEMVVGPNAIAVATDGGQWSSPDGQDSQDSGMAGNR